MLRTRKTAPGVLTTSLDARWGVVEQPRILGVRRIKPASFEGSHNRTKSVCLLLLSEGAPGRMQGGLLSAKYLSEWSGISYGSILASLGKWCAWHLIERSTYTRAKGRRIFVYSIAPKGKRWLARHERHMASQLQAYDAELRARRGFGFVEALAEKPLAPGRARGYFDSTSSGECEDNCEGGRDEP